MNLDTAGTLTYRDKAYKLCSFGELIHPETQRTHTYTFSVDSLDTHAALQTSCNSNEKREFRFVVGDEVINGEGILDWQSAVWSCTGAECTGTSNFRFTRLSKIGIGKRYFHE